MPARVVAQAVLLMIMLQGSTVVVQAQTLVTSSRLTLGAESNRSASVRLGDLDGDGDLDAVVGNGRHWPQQNFVFLNQGQAKFSVMRPLGVDRSQTYACELADLDGDGDLDIATGNDMALGKIFLNDGKGKFTEHSSFGSVSSVRSLTIADIDSDGDADILATCRGRANRIYLNDGNAQFKDGGGFGTKQDSTIDVAVADINGDGHQDLVLANRDGQPNQWLLNDGKLGFQKQRSFGDSKSQSRAVAVGDLNGDGNLDWVVGNIDQKNSVFLGDSEGLVKQEIEFGGAESKTYSIAVADMNGDGNLDIVTGNVGQRNAVFTNNGDGTSFQKESFGGVSGASYGLSVGDLNGDSRADVAVANSNGLNSLFLARRNRSATNSTTTKPKGNVKKESANVGQVPPASKALLESRKDEIPFVELPKYRSQNWPSFRGVGARGVAEGFSIRTSWNADASKGELDGVLWETAVPGLGHSSPVIFGDKIFLATAVASDGKAPLKVDAGGAPTAADDNGEQKWLLLCYDKTNGKELWRKTAHTGKPRATRHAKATHANTSVCVDGKHVVAFFGSEGIFCYDLDGNLVWNRDLGVINISKYGVGWGFASSPAIHGDQIAIVCDDPSEPYVASLRLSDGEEVWRKSRKDICERSWGTPLIHQHQGSAQVVVNGWPWIVSYDLNSGDELWRIQGGGDNPIPTPFEAHGWFYITNAHGGPAPIYVIQPGARGNLSIEPNEAGDEEAKTPQADSANEIVWSSDRGGSYMSTPVVYGDYLYLGTGKGVIRCFHAKTGEKIYEKRLGRKAGVIASLVAGDGKIYCASENGSVIVIAAGPEYKILATNGMSEPCLATPAISEGVLIFRTTNRLIAIK